MPLANILALPACLVVTIAFAVGFALYEYTQSRKARCYEQNRPRDPGNFGNYPSPPPRIRRTSDGRGNGANKSRNFENYDLPHPTVRKRTSDEISDIGKCVDGFNETVSLDSSKQERKGQSANEVCCRCCGENAVNTIALPCGHPYTCSNCAPILSRLYEKCPVCHEVIASFEWQ